MTKFVGDPDYTLRWPAEVFAEEAERLVVRGAEWGTGPDWAEEVDLLLRQAFTSSVPADDFKQVAETSVERPTYAYDEEPF
ncbi:MAG: hypothetical protein ACYC1D_11480 [Acidimicrobiales bacterium]